ncbi:hypothetical protein SDRG_12515 [Saprolegnia diclina VS20]|uniref:Beta-lactamase-related domain-containing protein n=1 Tax=Saprolegnia diclina (strain VS20) TaxID=1156394 RepID=T0RC05_SAPDV|nr:hypothetical protein SDRG_12515 [Saprolegnia diclina VS20]EQC29743.1 hypothetical protein SDRG_12515 [Saprolegnia diclina VS20]|eukprot:XP_008616809.1 hypothetical protein SDRG_12515 [Saprolegnia diclina VS20]
MQWTYLLVALLLQLPFARVLLDWASFGSTSHPRSLSEKKAMAIAFVQEQLATHAVPGLGVSIVYQNETILAQGFGTKEFGNAANVVTENTQFQIGSFTKTFIALGIAKLVDEGRLSWDDPVQRRLPWFQLVDKYAEQYTTLGDLAAMNSVFATNEAEVAWTMHVQPDEVGAVKVLRSYVTSRPLRAGYAYANINYVILGQVLAHATNMSWPAYLHKTFFQPLHMTHTYSSVPDVPQNGSDLSFGHVICNGEVAGPYDLRTSIETFSSYQNAAFAAGSIVSTPADLAIFSKFLLAKGAGIFSSPHAVETLITGHGIQTSVVPGAPGVGYTYHADGGVMAAGYGFDVVGNVMFGHNYFDKGGDMVAFRTRNGFLPDDALGVVLLSNAKAMGGPVADTYMLDRMRAYLIGLFLDVPEATLQANLAAEIAFANARRPPGACHPHVFGGKPWSAMTDPLPIATQDALVGTYVANVSADAYGNVTLSRVQNELVMRYGVYTAPLYAMRGAPYFFWAFGLSGAPIMINRLDTSSPTLDLGVPFVKTT